MEVGQNTIELLVTALNGTTTKTYMVHVVRAQQEANRNNRNVGRYMVPVLSNNAQLKELTISEGVLSPEFSQNIWEYTVEVPHETESMMIHPVAEHAKALVTVNGESVESGKESQPIALATGPNTIHVDVVAEDGSKLVYEIIVTRGEESEFIPQPPVEPICTPNEMHTDIDGHWSADLIREAVCKEIVTGYADGTFKPNEPITRAEFTVMLAGVAGWQTQESLLDFIDRDEIASWAEGAIAQAVEAGIVAGYVDGSFRPDAPITRAEMAVMIAKALNLTLADHGKTDFVDDADVPKWAKGAVEAIRKLGIISGRGNHYFVPNAHATRAEATVMVLQMSTLLNEF